MAPNTKDSSQKKQHIPKEYLNRQQGYKLNAQCKIEDVDLSTLNQDQNFVANIMHQNMDSQTLMIIMGVPGTGKSIVVKAVTNTLNKTVQNSTLVLCLGTTGTADFVMYGATCHYVLSIPINPPLNGSTEKNSTPPTTFRWNQTGDN